ncbi:NUDIX domain-containing protein [Candidatus Woesearchaeota archaeon]|nr:NUDIX domain-containing protein [Candidatus Woesearchaeota archaeon]
MEHEKSCGGLVICKKRVLILFNREFNGFSVPKGHLENGESEIDCAKREIFEETGLDVEQINDFRREITYNHKRFKTIKTVVLFFFKSRSMDIAPEKVVGSERHYDYLWCDYSEALQLSPRINAGSIVKEGVEELRRIKLI